MNKNKSFAGDMNKKIMYQSIPSLTIPPGNFLKGRIPHPQAQRKCETPTPGAEKSC